MKVNFKYLFKNIIFSDIIDNFKSVHISHLEQLYHCIPPIQEGLNNMQKFLIKDLQTQFMNNVQASSNESEESCGYFSMLSVKSVFFKSLLCIVTLIVYDIHVISHLIRFYNFLLQDETILKILKNLDLRSLYHISRVNKYFYNLVLDPLLYTCLNLKPYWHSFNAYALYNLSFRCKYLRKLDLSWCGNHGFFRTTTIKEFLINCGSLLTHLRLNCCENVDNSTICQISITCKNLKGMYTNTIIMIVQPNN